MKSDPFNFHYAVICSLCICNHIILTIVWFIAMTIIIIGHWHCYLFITTKVDYLMDTIIVRLLYGGYRLSVDDEDVCDHC